MTTWSPPSIDGRSAVVHAGRMILGLSVGLVAIGLVMVYSTSSAQRAATGENLAFGLTRQLCWVGLAVLVGYAVSRARLETLRAWSKPLLVVSILLLALTLIAGPKINQSRRWLRAGSLSLQTSELFKIAVLLYLADRLAARERTSSFGGTAPLLSMLAPVAAGVALVLVAPDLGTALFIVAESVVLLGLAGVKPRRVLPLVVFSLPIILIYAYARFGHVKKRLVAFTGDIQDNPQVREALVAIGSGGFFGVGLGRGTQKLHWIAESHTDFIFAIIGEELGFLGCAAIVCAFMAFLWFGRRIAWAARDWRPQDPYAFYLAAGATFLVAFQALINIAVVTATAPTKGVSLPFISVGGSNLLMACTCVGLLVGIARRVAGENARDPYLT